MAFKKIRLILLFSLFAVGEALAQAPPTKYAKEDVISDLTYLHETLQNAHHSPFAYTSKATLDSAYAAIKSNLNTDSVSSLAATNAFQRLAAVLKNGHTGVFFPIPEYISYGSGGGTLFPLEVALEEDKVLIRRNHAKEADVPLGAELLSINGKAMGDILETIYPQISAERPYFKKAKVEYLSLPRLHWQMFGPQAEYEVKIKQDGQVKTLTLQPIRVFEDYEDVRTDVVNAQMNLRFLENAAYLNPGNFGGDLKSYKSFIDSAFVEIKAAKKKNLIIDLRSNSGGDDPFSDYLVSYIADKPFRWTNDFSLRSSAVLKAHTRTGDTTTAYSKAILAHKNGEVFPYAFSEYEPQAKKKRFKGKVYVLVNRQSHSMSAVCAAQIQDYGWGTIVGEETGEYPSLYAAIFPFVLPKTGVTVSISKGYITRVNGSKKEEGVIPDLIIRDHLLDENDEILDGLLKRIEK